MTETLPAARHAIFRQHAMFILPRPPTGLTRKTEERPGAGRSFQVSNFPELENGRLRNPREFPAKPELDSCVVNKHETDHATADRSCFAEASFQYSSKSISGRRFSRVSPRVWPRVSPRVWGGVCPDVCTLILLKCPGDWQSPGH